MALFAATEATLIGTIVGSYFYLRINAAAWPPKGAPEPAILAPVLLTVALLASVVPFHGAVSAARRDDRARALALVAVATAVQAAYFGVQIHLFSASLDRFQPQAGAYASIYYVLLGAAHAHIAVGLLFDLWLLARLARRLTPYRLRALEAVALYWVVVAGITVVAVFTLLSPRL
jgi:heme/copper-type cytochrome/quinol oxidase subunit 3